MSKPQYTPGPWEVRHGIIYGNSVGGCRMEESTHMVAMIRGWGHLQYRDDGEAVQDANAHLIAAAPDMYEAAEAALECLEISGFGKAYVEDLLRTALRKARGGS